MIAIAMFVPVIVLTVATVSALRRAETLDPVFGELNASRWQR